MAQRDEDANLADMLGAISLEPMGSTEGKPLSGPAGLIHKDADAIKLFVGQIPKHMSEDELGPVFDEFGEIFDLAVIRDKISGHHRGCAFLTYCARDSADAAIRALHGQRKLEPSPNPLQVRPAEGQAEQENKLFVGMVPWSANEEEIRAVFSTYGALREVHIIRNQDGTNKGCAFVKYATRQGALRAIEDLNEQYTMQGGLRPLVVKFADNKRRSQAPVGRVGVLPSSASTTAGSYSETGEWLGHLTSAQRSGYAYPLPVPVSPQMMGSMSYLSYGSAPTTGPPPQGGYMHYPYVPSGISQSTLGSGSLCRSGPPSPVRGSEAYRGGGHIRSPLTFEHHHRSKGTCEDSEAEIIASSRPAEGPLGANLFIYHLPHDLSDADLTTAFAPFGQVISAKVYVDRNSGESKGFGFVSYDQAIHAKIAISKMNGFQIGTKRLKVQHKRCGQTSDDLDRVPGGSGSGGNGYGDAGDYYTSGFTEQEDKRFVECGYSLR